VIDVNIDDNEISITDRAGGIAWADFPRAFSPAAPPDDASGLSEFGLGMKAAACWFSRRWSVRTSALGEPVERTVTFDVPQISREGLENLPIETRPARDSDHFTVVTMQDLRVQPRGRTLSKIKDHLRGIYRVLMKDGVVKLRLTVGGSAEELTYQEPDLLIAPYFRAKSEPARLWRREVAVELNERRVTGWVGILRVGSHAKAGFSVFRRRRLIEGTAGEKYKPNLIFGSPNSFASQRIIGELFVEGFDVTHTKDGIQWHGYEDDVVEAIRQQMDLIDMPILDQAEGYRVRKTADTLPSYFGIQALETTAFALSSPEAAGVVRMEAEASRQEDVTASETPSPPVLQQTTVKMAVKHGPLCQRA
jgi:Histidine kinase-, DNA gyrase B-, and HSP90-like ATPase